MSIYTFFILTLLKLSNFDYQITIKIIHVNEKIVLDSQIDDVTIKEACELWELSNTQIENFFMNSTKTSSYEINSLSYFPCGINGELFKNDTIFNFYINGAGWGKIEYRGEEQFYQCEKSNCEYIGM